MTFTFETLPIENKETLRQGIIDLFDRDIATVSCSFNTRNYVFVFGEGCFPAIIRVSPETSHRQVEDVLSEMMWMDDLKNDVPNICQPIPSLSNRMVERIAVDDKIYLTTMFRKANGSILQDTKWDKQFFYNTAVLLGKIHRTSAEGYERGFRYKRKQWDDNPVYDFSNYDEYYQPSARKDAEAVLKRIRDIPKDPRWYGMIHGDYQNGNLFYDWGDLWVFDFDDCCYGYFMFDIACLVHVYINSRNYEATCPNVSAHDRLLAETDGILSIVRAGYSTEYQLPDEQWDSFHDFFRLRVAQINSLQLALKIYPREIIMAMTEPLVAYLKSDKLPIDQMEDVRIASAKLVTPEMRVMLSKAVMG